MTNSTSQTPYGTLHVLAQEDILEKIAQFIEDAHGTVGLTGGSTPKAFYKWAVEKGIFSEETIMTTTWSASDERVVPLDSEDSNFGNADRMLLSPLNVRDRRKLPWDMSHPPENAANEFHAYFSILGKAFDLCLLGMGDDCHTASLFPQSPLLKEDNDRFFAAIDVPGKGQRLTITPTGLDKCSKIVITVTGPGKADALKQVLEGEHDPFNKPAQVLQKFADKTVWLVDTAAASKLEKL